MATRSRSRSPVRNGGHGVEKGDQSGGVSTEGPQEPRSQDDLIAMAFMLSAAASARAGVQLRHGGPFGASIVRDGVIIACAHNMVLHGKDPTKHAEMNAIQQACQSIGSHDLSDCELYTSCEPCPMCWGAVQWSRLGKVYLGVDRTTAAKYGFDDLVFYNEIYEKAGCYGLRRYGYIPDSQLIPEDKPTEKPKERIHKNMVEVYDGILEDDVQKLFMDPLRNRTLRRRFASSGSKELQAAYGDIFTRDPHADAPRILPRDVATEKHEAFMKLAIAAAEKGMRSGRSKEREPFGAVIVRGEIVIAEAHNTVLEQRDATATAEVNAIRLASEKLGTHNLEGCDIYSTSHPDLMSLGAILWARISRVYCGVTQQLAAQCGHEDGLLHFKDLLMGEGDVTRRVTEVVEGVAKEECEAVFQTWSDLNGVIY